MPSVKKEIQPISITLLDLDPQNPRLPEGMDGSASAEVVQYYWDNYVLSELVDSFRGNGYFAQEPLIVLPDRDRFIVLEGNRRLAALIQMLALPGSIKGLTDPPTESLRREFAEIPCLVVDSRDEVAPYLGFRHIGGIQPWPPESKARFVSKRLAALEADGFTGNPFAHVARMVGTNAQGIRITYFAFQLLVHARVDLGLDTAHIASERFGVWQRCMSSRGVLERLNVTVPRDFADFSPVIRGADAQWIRNVIRDLSPDSTGAPPILTDSRDVTTYGHVLANDRAYKTLQETRDLRVAEQLVSDALLATKIDRVSARVKALIDEAELVEECDERTLDSAKVLAKRAKVLVVTIEA